MLTVKREALLERVNLSEFGFSPCGSEIFEWIDHNKVFLDRSEAEENDDYKQIIPYCAITFENSILLVKRTKKQSESRLHNMFSLGIGGHINESDLDEKNGPRIIHEALYRELFEELDIDENQISEVTFFGFINDDLSKVGRVHLGLFFEIKVDVDSISIREKQKMHGQFYELSSLNDFYEKMETWSQIVFRKFYLA